VTAAVDTVSVAAPPRSPALAPFVEELGYFEGSFRHTRERGLPTGKMQLLVNLHADRLRSYRGDALSIEQRIGGAGLQGACSRPVGMDTADQQAIAWVSFRPGGALPFFPAPPAAVADALVDLDALWGYHGFLLRERLLAAPTPAAKLGVLEAALLEQVVRPLRPDPVVGFAVAALERGVAVGAVTDRLGLTSRRFVATFSEAVGLRPKRFARVRRFQRLLEAAGGEHPDWSRLAIEFGYFDQAHLINDFRAFAGTSPTAYRARPDGQNHVPLD
jgi:AraC-like DNA-binding protein